MTELFERHGAAHTGAVSHNEKGQPFFMHRAVCSRCGGAGGAEVWNATGWTCFKCGGSGRGEPKVVRLFTADELVKLNARKAKADERRTAKAKAKAEAAAAEVAARLEAFMAVHGALIARAEKVADKSAFVADVVAKGKARAEFFGEQASALETAVAKIEAAAVVAAASNHVGKVGERITVAVTVERVAHFDRPKFGWRDAIETVNIVTMRTAEGNALVVKSPAFFAEQGETFTVKGTIKEHSEFRGEKQTVLQRAAVVVAPKQEAAA